jgi:tetratricopeptide (TPR) repeat protein
VNISDVGLPAAQQVVLLGEEDSPSLDLLGWLLSLAARYDEAEQMLARALELDPQNASAHLHLGTLYLGTDERAGMIISLGARLRVKPGWCSAILSVICRASATRHPVRGRPWAHLPATAAPPGR